MNLEDMEAIRSLTHQYAYHIDRFELEPLVALWTDDAVFDESSMGMPVCRGPAEIRSYFAQVFTAMKTQVHYASNFILRELDGNLAQGTCYFLAEGVTSDGGKVHATGYYTDEYARTRQGWRFQSRRVFAFNPPDLGAYDASMASA